MPKRNKKLALKLGIQTCQILTNYDDVCIPNLSSILLAVSNNCCKLNTYCNLVFYCYNCLDLPCLDL